MAPTYSPLIKGLEGVSRLPVPHYIFPNPSNAGSDSALVAAMLRVSGGVACNIHSLVGCEAALLAQSRVPDTKLALLFNHTGGYGPTFQNIDTIIGLLDSTVIKKPDAIVLHCENVEFSLEVAATYYSEIKARFPDVPISAYGSGVVIGYGGVGRRTEYPPLAPFDHGSFDLYWDNWLLNQETIRANLDSFPQFPSYMPWLSWIGSYSFLPTSSNPRNPIQWSRAYRRTPSNAWSMGYSLMLRYRRELNLAGVMLYPFGPDRPEEVAPMVQALAAYASGWANQTPIPVLT